MFGRDSGLERKRTGSAAGRVRHEEHRFFDLLAIPSAPVLIVEEDHVSCFVEARLTPRVVKEHEREEPCHFARSVGA
jgi:hypothetical protein